MGIRFQQGNLMRLHWICSAIPKTLEQWSSGKMKDIMTFYDILKEIYILKEQVFAYRLVIKSLRAWSAYLVLLCIWNRQEYPCIRSEVCKWGTWQTYTLWKKGQLAENPNSWPTALQLYRVCTGWPPSPYTCDCVELNLSHLSLHWNFVGMLYTSRLTFPPPLLLYTNILKMIYTSEDRYTPLPQPHNSQWATQVLEIPGNRYSSIWSWVWTIVWTKALYFQTVGKKNSMHRNKLNY